MGDLRSAVRFGELRARLDGAGNDTVPDIERLRELLGIARQRIQDLEAALAALEARVPNGTAGPITRTTWTT